MEIAGELPKEHLDIIALNVRLAKLTEALEQDAKYRKSRDAVTDGFMDEIRTYLPAMKKSHEAREFWDLARKDTIRTTARWGALVVLLGFMVAVGYATVTLAPKLMFIPLTPMR